MSLDFYCLPLRFTEAVKKNVSNRSDVFTKLADTNPNLAGQLSSLAEKISSTLSLSSEGGSTAAGAAAEWINKNQDDIAGLKDDVAGLFADVAGEHQGCLCREQ